MITVVIQGGLGNQLFQYAYGKALKSLGKEVQFDISFFQGDTKYTKRPFGLPHFSIDTSIPQTTVRHTQSFWRKVFNRLDIDRKVRYVPISPSRDNYIADGYYNTEKYFSQIRETLLKEITLKDGFQYFKDWEQKIRAAKKPLIVYARRGDYLKSTGFVILDEAYYKRALAEFDDDCEIFGFSDDPEWLAAAVGRPIQMVSIPGVQEYYYEEMMLMSLGQNFVIANSTFSWWGAWLSQHPNKKIVGPKKWFRSVLWWRADRDVIPETWIRV